MISVVDDKTPLMKTMKHSHYNDSFAKASVRALCVLDKFGCTFNICSNMLRLKFKYM